MPKTETKKEGIDLYEVPNRPCPECGTRIHVRAKSHECGWGVVSKMEAVRRVLDYLGEDTNPRRIKRALMKQFRLNVTPTLALSYKTSILTTRKKRRAARLRAKG